MKRSISLDSGADELVLTFPFDRALKDFVKAIPRSRFEWNSKTWRLPAGDAAEVIPLLVEHGFEVEPAVASLVGNDVGPTSATVTEVNRSVAGALRERFPAPFWITGEIANWSRNARRRHAYFTLCESDDVGRPEAQIDAVLFATARERVENRLRTAGLELNDGSAVRLLVRVEMYEERGRIQLVVQDVDVRYSAGELALRREEVLNALREKGVIDRQLARPMPKLPKRIALLTSVGSDAYHDFVHTLARAPYGFDVVPFDVRVQGADLESTVTAALRAIERAHPAFDLVVITRGGGSRTELGQWDNYRVASAVCTSRTKIVVAIGHQQDRSVLDDVATSYKTPTEAAERIVERWALAEARLDETSRRLQRSIRSRLALAEERLASRAAGIGAGARARIVSARGQVKSELPRLFESFAIQRTRAERASLDRLATRAESVTSRRGPSLRREQLDEIATRVARVAQNRADGAKSRNEQVERRLTLAVSRQIARAEHLLDAAARQVVLADPARIIRRGFAIVRDQDGGVVTRATGLEAHQILELSLSDGVVKTRVEDDDA